MTDVHDPATRSRNMAAIRSRDTKPELAVRHALHRRGLRYRLHAQLPGHPDMVFTKYRAVIFVHGCFFHRHECDTFRWPETRAEFWRAKIEGNAARDRRTQAALHTAGWRVGVVWECALRGKAGGQVEQIAERLEGWLRGVRIGIEICA